MGLLGKALRIGAAVATGGTSELAIAGYNALTDVGPMPTVPTLGVAPNPNDEATAAKLLAAEDAQRKIRDRASTVLTSQSGVSGSAVTASRTLMGS